MLYEDGQGVVQDFSEAAHWYRRAAEQGYALAQNNLGVLYANGQGLPMARVTAFAWYSVAAARGNAKSSNYVGSFYENEKSLRAFAGELGATFPVLLDNGAKLADLYSIRAYPQTLFLSPDGKILAALLGGVGEAELGEILGKYL